MVHLGVRHEKVLEFVPIDMKIIHKKIHMKQKRISKPRLLIEERKERDHLKTKMKDERKVDHVGNGWVSRWQARRAPYHLSINDLKKLKTPSILGEKHGTSGIFYPIEEIIMLSEEIPWIPPAYICESRITKQMKKKTFDIQKIRTEGLWGKIQGERGAPHYHYSEEYLMNHLTT